ncbi:hypothetical protein [Rugosimonospora africana]|uniref:Uncharacterized protein n=1 Tax=Rugosimonospora africana TaxID=556532 RepID=A0A8J3R2W3_9ACTN|nr:hypothetical protein [Rugosimonospora africana]GIH20678.1 hypothetical protein Raf01_88500 [Rugosimonospora africana]
MTAIDPNGYACATCRSPLNVHTVDGASHFDHPHPPADNHPPRPVPIHHVANLAMICDFCSTPDPQWSYHFGNIDIFVTLPGGDALSGHNFGERWAACTRCANLIDAGDQAGLTRRAQRRARHWGQPSDATAHLEQLHRALLANGIPHRQPLHTATTPATSAPATPQPSPEGRHIRPTSLPKVRDRLTNYWRRHATTDLATALTPEQIHTLTSQLTPDTDTPDTRSPIDRYTALMAQHAHHATLYWIDPDFTELARHAATSLHELQIAPHEPLAREGLMIWSNPICHPPLAGTTQTVPVIAAQWGTIPGGLWLTFFAPAETTGTRAYTAKDLQQLRERVGWLAPISIGTRLEFDKPYSAANPHTHAVLATLLATWLIAAQPEAQTDDIEPDKAIRRAYARAQRPAPPVRIVKLRGKQRRTPTTPDAGNEPTRIYRNRWWVPGFFRQQPYGPKQSLRRRRYVRGHFRGPDGAPLILTKTVRVLGNPHAEPPPPTNPHETTT